jgi:hypothetical protein
LLKSSCSKYCNRPAFLHFPEKFDSPQRRKERKDNLNYVVNLFRKIAS